MGGATLFCGWSSSVRIADPFPDREDTGAEYATGAVLNTRGSHWSGAEYATGAVLNTRDRKLERGARSKARSPGPPYLL